MRILHKFWPLAATAVAIFNSTAALTRVQYLFAVMWFLSATLWALIFWTITRYE